MADFIVETTKKVIVNHSGLVFIAKYLNDVRFFSRINKISKIKKNSGVISDYDIIKTYIALICLGKTDFEDVEQYRNDKFFKKVLNLHTVPSSVTLRQRLESYGEEMWAVLRETNVEWLQNHIANETIEINEVPYIILESDVTPMDNSGSKKEGVTKTYKQFFGFAPMMSYFGKSGFMINNELREGSCHSNCEGTDKYFEETIGLTKQLGSYPLLAIMDSGNDDSKLVLHFKELGAEFIIKRNLRREGIDKYKEYAMANGKKKASEKYKDSTVYYSNWEREVEGEKIPIAVVVTEYKKDRKGIEYLMPQYDVEVYWNSLNLEAEQVEKLYHQHGTSEQYHSEFKSDLDMERLPSGKFDSNYGFMLMGMLAFNLLRFLGKELLVTGLVPGKRGLRLRIRTVLQNIMYMGCQYISKARRNTIKVFEEYLWTPCFVALFE